MAQTLWRTAWRFPKKLRNPYDPAIPLLAMYLEKIIIQKDICTPMFIATLFTIARTWKHLRFLSLVPSSYHQFLSFYPLLAYPHC